MEERMSDVSRGVCGKEQQAQTCFPDAEELEFIIPRLKIFFYTFFCFLIPLTIVGCHFSGVP